jgi:hypothetical protein
MPAQAFLPRQQVRDWCEDIGQHPLEHKAAILRVVRSQRKLLALIKQNQDAVGMGSPRMPERLFGLICRLFDLAGGALREPRLDAIAEAQERVLATLPSLLPADSDLPSRVRAIPWRAQPHVLDELLTALFDARLGPEDRSEPAAALKLFLLLWTAIEVLDGSWKPGARTPLEPTYQWVDLPPTRMAADAPSLD